MGHDPNRGSYDVIFENSETAVFHSWQSLFKFSKSAGRYGAINKTVVGAWIKEYERYITKDRVDRIVDAIRDVITNWHAFRGRVPEMPARDVRLELESASMLENVTLLVIWYHVNYTDDLNMDEVEKVVVRIFSGESRDEVIRRVANISRRIHAINAAIPDHQDNRTKINCYILVKNEVIPKLVSSESERGYWRRVDQTLKMAAEEGSWIERGG